MDNIIVDGRRVQVAKRAMVDLHQVWRLYSQTPMPGRLQKARTARGAHK